MPSIDTLLWILAAAIPLGMGALGGHLSSNRPLYRWLFWGLGFLGVLVVGVAGVRNEHAQSALQTQLDKIQRNTENPPQVTVNVPPSPPPIILNGETHQASLSLVKIELPSSLNTKPFAVNVHLANVGQVPIEGVFFWETATFQPIGEIDSSRADRLAYSDFLKRGKEGVRDAKKSGHAPSY